MTKILWAIGLAVSLASCSNQQVYEAARQNSLQDCDKREGVERERCQAQYRESYQEYERKRADALRKQSTAN